MSEFDKEEEERAANADPDVAMEKSAQSEPETDSTLSSFQRGVLVFALCCATFLAALDITIITTSLPTISNHFHSSAAYVWIGAAYMLADGASTPINIVISDLFSLRDRPKYYGFVGMTWAIASSIGPLLGGALSQKVSWRWCFYINLPITALAFAIVVVFLRLKTPKTPFVAGLKAMDWLGCLSIVGATVMLLLGLNFGGVTHPWSSPIVINLIVFGVVAFVLFLVVEYRVALYPIIPFRVFNTAATATPLLACLLHGFVLVISTYFLPLYFQSILGAGPLLSGVWLLPLALSMGFSAALAGWAISATGKYLIFIRVGFVLITLSSGLLIMLPHSRSWAGIIIYQILLGVGIGPNFQALLVALQNSVHGSDSGTATATFGFARNLATSIGLVLGEVVFQNVMNKQYSTLNASLGPQLAGSLASGSAESSVFIINALPSAQRTVARNAFYLSLKDVWILQTAFAAVGLFVICFLSGKDLSQEHQTVETGLDAEAGRAEKARMERMAGKPGGMGDAA